MKNKFQYLVIAGVFFLLGTFLTPIIFHSAEKVALSLAADNKRDMSPAKTQAVAMEDAFQEVFDKVSPSVVSIATERTVKIRSPFGGANQDPFLEYFFGQQGRQREFSQKQAGLGSGIILNSEGYILTNEHVIRDMDKLAVRFKNKKLVEAKLIGSDPKLDLALLKVKPVAELVPITLGDSTRVRVGNWAIAIGAPMGFEQSFTVGVVSASARPVDESGVGYIQTDAAINQGNSGGPLLNIHGEVIGINRMIISPSGGSIGIGFSIPINEAKRVFEELKTTGKVKHSYPWFGIGLDQIQDESGVIMKGAMIRVVAENSPAEKAGLQVKDIVQKIDGKDVESPEDVVSYVRASKVGKKIELQINRKGSTMKITVTTGERPNQ
ncbi:MAG: trypsin-like peptidase domain-containing protein [Leptospiraceae bacterium]|nr:trypsin-like peptidase domain-containing protein [Leptospiraceae bacterium]